MSTTILSDKLPPHRTEAEEAVLGSVLLYQDVIEDIPSLTPQDFYSERHGIIYDAILTIHARHEAVDYLTVVSEIEQRGKLGDVGGAAYIISLINKTPSALNVASYAEIVRGMATRRGLLLAAQEAARLAHSEDTDTVDAVNGSMAAFENVLDGHVGTHDTTRHARDVAADVLAMAYVWKNDPKAVRGIASGLDPVDEMLGGFQPGELVSVAGRPGQGKSALLGRLAWGVARKMQGVLVFSLEMDANAMMRRMACQMSHTNANMLKAGRLTEKQFDDFKAAAEEIAGFPLWIEARSGLTVREMQAITRRYERKHGLSMVMVDTLNRVKGDGKSLYEVMTNNSHAMADWAHNSNLSVMQAVQMSRANEQAADKRPTLAALRDSGAIEEDNDIILGLYRPHYYDRDNTEVEHVAELRVLKFRDGDSDAEAELYWRSECVSFDKGTHTPIDTTIY